MNRATTSETAVSEGGAARRRRVRGSQTRARLLDAAVDEFAERGFHGAKISEIVRRAGVTQPSFYLYFESKAAIHDQLVERVRSELRDLIARARIPANTPATMLRKKLVHAIEIFLRYFEENPRLAPIAYFDPERGAAVREEVVALVTTNIAFEQGAGFCRPELDPQFVSQCYNGSLDRLIRTYLLTGQHDAHTLALMVANLYGLGSIPEGGRASNEGAAEQEGLQ